MVVILYVKIWSSVYMCGRVHTHIGYESVCKGFVPSGLVFDMAVLPLT